MKEQSKTDLLSLGCLCLLAVFALWQTVKYIRLGNLTAFVTVAVLEALVLLFGLLSLRGRMPWLMLLLAVSQATASTNPSTGSTWSSVPCARYGPLRAPFCSSGARSPFAP